MPELEEQIETTETYGNPEAEVVEETDQADETEIEETVETETEAEVEEDSGREDYTAIQQQNAELQRRIIDLIETQQQAAQPKAPAPPALRDILAKRFDDKTADNLAEALSEYEEVLAQKFAPREELHRMTGTLANLARNADEARVFEDMRGQGIPDKDIKAARAELDRMVKGGSYFANAEDAMYAAYGRLNRERAKKTATETSAARANKTAKRQQADVGTNRGGAGVPVLTKEEKAALYQMDTADFLDELARRGYGKK